MDEPSQVFDDQAFDSDIKKQATFWQKILALQDWNVDVRISRQWEMSDQTTVAQIEWFLTRKDAILRVVHPTDLPGLSKSFIHGEENDYDISLVHELLHLHFAPLGLDRSDKRNEIAEEQAINAISRGIVKLYRDRPTPELVHPTVTTSLHGYL